MLCRLLIPRLPAADLPTLRLLGARGTSLPPPEDGAEAWLCQAFGVARQTDWPAAPYSLLGEGVDPGNGYWLHADPVHLRLMRNYMILFGGPELTVSADEAQAWCATLERHFSDDGLRFVAPHPLRWYLRLAEGPGPATHPLAAVLGREIRPWLPQGTRWLKLLNEIQMLLHADPRNTLREEQGLAPVNSVWLWGGGKLQGQPTPPCTAVYADHPLARGLATAAHIPAHPLPASAATCLAEAGGDLLIVADGPTAEELENNWLVPLKNALAKGQLERLAIIVPGQRQIEVSRLDLWKFWRGG
ncbi:MAG: hypothetical protein KGZ83_10205 [Sulfuricella sp.]|nr:hypothetical protein [Sulfuricella sp.]